MAASFAPFQDEFLEITSSIVWRTATTVDPAGRPRSRILLPIFVVHGGRPLGRAFTGRTPVKTAHLACSSWSPDQHTVAIDCGASWVEDAAAKRAVWDRFKTPPPPLGYDPDPAGALGGPESPLVTPLRLDPWRVAVLRFEGWDKGLAPRVWLAERAG